MPFTYSVNVQVTLVAVWTQFAMTLPASSFIWTVSGLNWAHEGSATVMVSPGSGALSVPLKDDTSHLKAKLTFSPAVSGVVLSLSGLRVSSTDVR